VAENEAVNNATCSLSMKLISDHLLVLQQVVGFNIEYACVGTMQGNNVVAVAPQQHPRNTFSTSSALEAGSHANASVRQV